VTECVLYLVGDGMCYFIWCVRLRSEFPQNVHVLW